MVEAEIYGCKALLSAVITRALIDSTLYRNPRHPYHRIYRRPKNIKIKVFLATYPIITNPNNYNLTYIKLCRDIFNRYFEDMENEKIAWEARNFISSKNYLFKTYAHFLDIDPQYFEEKFNKQIKLFDHYQENILEKYKDTIDITKVNMS